MSKRMKATPQLVDAILEEAGVKYIIWNKATDMYYAGDGMWLKHPHAAKQLSYRCAVELAGAINTQLDAAACIVREKEDAIRDCA
ncbi:MAG: NmrA family NAD(P)-binding protein [Dehalococcoidia bacterium]|nr:NmrA family NAD(P)-binding protein [Dehalococcoidia bacterium]